MAEPDNASPGQRFRILSLSGGGVRGIFIAAALAEIERTGKRVREHFDLIAGTSTGGLIALALAFDQPASRILEQYQKHIPAIFPVRRFKKLRQLFCSKYDNKPLAKAVREIVGSAELLGAAKNRLCIPAVHYDDMWPTVLKTRHHTNYVRDHQLPAWHVGMATSAAPTYFEAFRSEDGRTFWDGGLWANDPTLVAIIEAVGSLGVPLDQIDVLRIGTTRTIVNPPAPLASSGAWPLLKIWKPVFVDFLGRLSEHASIQMSKIALRTPNLPEVDDILEGIGFELDDAAPATLASLIDRGRYRASCHGAMISERFLSMKAAPFVPFP